MSRNDLELRLIRWLDDGPDGAPPAVVAAALAQSRTERQVRVISLPWTLRQVALPPSNSLAQAAISVAAIVIAVTMLIWGLNSVTLPPATSPTPTAASASETPITSPPPSVTPTPSASALPSPTPASTSTTPPISSPLPSPSATPASTASLIAGQWPVAALVGAGDFDDFDMAVDADGGVHIAAAIGIGAGDSRGIIYLTNSSGVWTDEQVTTAPPGQDDLEFDGEPDIAVDAEGTVWIAFTRYDCGGCTPTISEGVYVMSNVGGSWTQPEQIAGSQAYGPSLDVRAGVAHLAYSFGQMPEALTYPVYYATNKSGTWVSTRITTDARLAQVAVGLDGVARVAYITPTGVSLNSFPSADAFLTQQVPGPGENAEGLVHFVDPAGRTHILWSELSPVMHEVVQDQTGRWSEPADVIFDLLTPDTITSDGFELYSSARSFDQGGAWFVHGANGTGIQLAPGEVVTTDLVTAAGRLYFAYSLAGTEAAHGIWFTQAVGE
jgi:hypothetical protein